MPFALTVDSALLADAAGWVSRVLPSRPTSPILGGILLEATAGQLVLSAYDQVSAQVTVAATVGQPGTVLVSGRLLAAVVKAMPRKPVTMEQAGSVLQFTVGSVCFTLPMMDHRNYPALPQLPPDAGSLDAAAFSAAITQVASAAPRHNVAGYAGLAGIYLHAEPCGELTMVATDRHRMAIARLPWPADTAISDVVVPTRGLTEAKITDTDTVFLAVPRGGHGGVFAVHDGPRTATIRLLDEQFPRHELFLVPKHAGVATLVCAEVAAAVGRALVVANNKDNRIQMTFESVATPSGVGRLTLVAGELPGRVGDEITPIGSCTETLDVAYAGDPLCITFNARFLLDGLDALRAPFARMGFEAADRPVVLRPLLELKAPSGPGPFDAIDTPFTYILMPIRPTGR